MNPISLLRSFTVIFALLAMSPLARAENDAASPQVLRWAADAKSGAPYMFVDPKNPTQMQGFEKDIMEAVAEKMGRKLVFVQNEWDSLVPGLNRGDYDIAANGIEITPERKQQIHFSIPYYATFEQIVVRADDDFLLPKSKLQPIKIGRAHV